MKEKEKKRSETKKQRKRNLGEDEVMNKTTEESKKKLVAKKDKNRKKETGTNVDITEHSQTISRVISDEKTKGKKDKLKKMKKKKKQKVGEGKSILVDNQVYEETKDGLHEKDNEVKTCNDSGEIDNTDEADNGTRIRIRKSKKPNKKKKRGDPEPSKPDENFPEKTGEADEDEVYQISSGDEDCSQGMKKWVTDYYASRPGLKELQERIDDFITAHEEQLEQERKEREAKAAEGGWTVVVHHKGRKKTTDSESGTTVGSAAPAAVEDKMTKKKQKEVVAHDFYRFQKREAQRNEIMALQSKFEEDKKRIQQLRAARKFKPY